MVRTACPRPNLPHSKKRPPETGLRFKRSDSPGPLFEGGNNEGRGEPAARSFPFPRRRRGPDTALRFKRSAYRAHSLEWELPGVLRRAHRVSQGYLVCRNNFRSRDMRITLLIATLTLAQAQPGNGQAASFTCWIRGPAGEPGGGATPPGPTAV